MGVFARIQDPGPSADPRTFNELSQIPLAPIKLAAMYALGRMRSPLSVKTLIAHLDDPDQNIQFLAVTTLNGIVQNGDDYGPSDPDFGKQPSLYIARWQRWWDEKGRYTYSSQ
jgi:hypothetical protein